ncbi:hypothetical protein Vadar_033605 [Vaccinium darrowii]|uniref:Uncharacterized protein n=1 Tax=Vaccinium darrowii TaxID=229202 RepID=A0ACB7Y570_9ERIC|nr:hypothetical protein Vadar_033605 [Vaccinium darrowii]
MDDLLRQGEELILNYMVKCIKDAKIDIFLVTPNSTVDGLEDMDIGNWEWDCGTFLESGITLEDYDTAEGLGGTIDWGGGGGGSDDSNSDGNYEHFSNSDYDMSEEDDILYSQNVDRNTEWMRKKKGPPQSNNDDGHEYEEGDEGDILDSDSGGGFNSLDEEEEEGCEQTLKKSIVFRPLRGITPTLKVSELMEKCREQLKCRVSQSPCYRAKHKILRKIEGSEEEQHAKLWDYSEKILRNNPDTSVYIQLKSDEDGMPTNTFQRFYICWEALKWGFIEVVEIENTSTWTSFLIHLIKDIEIANAPTWTIIFDKQKGLENAIQELLPAVEHRHCVRHLHNNFKSVGFAGQSLKDKLWNLARTSYVGRFNALMEELEKDDPAVYEWLSHPSRNPCHWSRSHFIFPPKCDILLNNLCEPFNKAIPFARDKPILTMLERLRLYLMDRVVKRREFASTWHDDLGPKIHKRIEKVKQRYGDYYIVPCGNDEFEARSFNGGQHTVNLAMQSCSYRRWELNGIPCEHGAIVIAQNGGQPEDHVSEWYHKHSFLASYNHIMHPMNGFKMWGKSGKPPIIPQNIRSKVEGLENLGEGNKMNLQRTHSDSIRANVTANPRANSTASTTPMAMQRTRKRKNAKTVTTTQEAPRRTLRLCFISDLSALSICSIVALFVRLC